MDGLIFAIYSLKKSICSGQLGVILKKIAMVALANLLYKATGKRFYEQPFLPQLKANNVTV